jgi:hypothetical protein
MQKPDDAKKLEELQRASRELAGEAASLAQRQADLLRRMNELNEQIAAHQQQLKDARTHR